MISFINGNIIIKYPKSIVVITVNGIGYEIYPEIAYEAVKALRYHQTEIW